MSNKPHQYDTMLTSSQHTTFTLCVVNTLQKNVYYTPSPLNRTPLLRACLFTAHKLATEFIRKPYAKVQA